MVQKAVILLLAYLLRVFFQVMFQSTLYQDLRYLKLLSLVKMLFNEITISDKQA